MGKNPSNRVLVYSTAGMVKPVQERRLSLRMERKGRGGKTVTVISGFTLPPHQVEELARRLKSACGTGGTVEDGEIVLQGQVRDRAMTLLRQWGLPVG